MRFCLLATLLFAILTTSAQPPSTLFTLLSPSETGVDFRNTITESDTLNILNQANIYNGGGVGIGDFNNDGLMDIYLAGNMVPNKMYLNKGSLKFQDITNASNTAGLGRWCTGVSVVDVNADGLADLYLSASFRKDPLRRTNLLYINQGNNRDGVPVFKEMAKSYGLADTSYSTQGVFFDYDKDGDLDVYLVINEIYDPKTPINYHPKITDGSAQNTDKLFRNNGNGTFTNVSAKAGITIEGWGHAAVITDFNFDGWPDIYVANDFISNDLLFINNKNGTFTNKLGEYFKHTGWNAMGTDVADLNNDGYADLLSLEMLPEDNLRKKTMLRGDEYFNYFYSKQHNYEHQYVRNVLQLNSGMTPKGHPVFSDLAFMAGVYQTDWSWAPLIADFDNDGLRDIVITNGLPRDVTDLDYISYNNGQGGGEANLSLAMVDSLPIVKIRNYAFKNKGQVQFENTTERWGFTTTSFSNGGVYADLDNDGDQDIVINNINDPAFIYRNTGAGASHFLSVAFRGTGKNTGGIGAVLRIYHKNGQQLYEHYPCRGYLSTMDPRAHFGLGDVQAIDSLIVQWPEGATEKILNPPVDKTIILEQKNSSRTSWKKPAPAPLFRTASGTSGLKFLHQEKDAIDYNIQPTLPHKLSQFGPGVAVGDIDNNGWDDVFFGGTPGYAGCFYLQNEKGKFTRDDERIAGAPTPVEEDMGVLLFDADNDKDLDLYVASGSYEFSPQHFSAQDRLYVNDGKGFFEKNTGALPIEYSNGSCVRAADFDADGDLDLFVGGRSVSGSYPLAPESFLLRNEGGRFVDATAEICPELRQAGMITDALWSDYNNDGRPDLVLAGEWMPVVFFRNTGESLVKENESGIAQHAGWWNSLVSGDFDSDGDLDYVAGNLGLNSNYKATPEEPMELLAKDLDENGKIELMVFCYMMGEDGKRRPYPMHARDDMVSQLQSIRKTYPTYKSYGLASIADLWTPDQRQNAVALKATHLATSYLENKGNGAFSITSLPPEAQAAPVYGMKADDYDKDGHLDLLMVGNDYGMEPGSGRHDAFNGLYLRGDGTGKFSAVHQDKSGFFVGGDAKGLASVHTLKGDLLVATQNNDSAMVYLDPSASTDTAAYIRLNNDDAFAEIQYANNKKRRVEFYYGSGYLSQSSRVLRKEKNVTKIVMTGFAGKKREVLIANNAGVTNKATATAGKVFTNADNAAIATINTPGLSLAASVFTSADQAAIATSNNSTTARSDNAAAQTASFLHRAMKQVTDVIVYDIFSPPVASRIYAYTAVAAYEAAIHKEPNFKSLAGQLNDLRAVPAPARLEYYDASLSSVQAMLIVARSLVISEDKIDKFHGQLVQEFRNSGIADSTVQYSLAYGKQVADHILQWASKDNYKQIRSYPRYDIAGGEGQWKPTPPAYMKAVEPNWNQLRTFLIDSAQQFKPLPPAPFSTDKNSRFYKEAVEVMNATSRLSEEKKEIANFWDCNPFKININGHVMFATKKISPGGHWINITALACQKVSAGWMPSAEAYASVAVAMADCFISCWDEKYRSKVIRPETYINENIDRSWVPLLQTPPFPEYTSGHSVVSAAAAIVLTRLFGENFSYADSTEVEFKLPVRHFTSFTQAAEEAAISRFYGGIHYMTSITNGVTEGRALGQYVIQKLQTRQPATVNVMAIK